MKRKLFIPIFFLFLIPAILFSFELSYSGETVTVCGDIDNYKFVTAERGAGQYTIIETPYTAKTSQPGLPQLPLFSKLVALPETGNFILQDLTYDTSQEKIIEPILHAGWEDGNVPQKDFYSKDEWYPKEIVTVGDPVIMRGYRFCQIAIAPFQYNPATQMIRVLKNIDAGFKIDHSIDNNPLIRTIDTQSSSFSKIASAHIVGVEKSRNNEHGSYLIICPDGTETTLQPLAEWKTKLGYEVILTPLSTIGASPSNQDIKDYIQNAYLSWDNPPEYVILVGDVTGNFILPSFYVQGFLTPYDVSDHPYALLDGTDYFPDVFVGRLSIQTQMDLMTQVSKIIKYESSQTGEDWYHKALMISCIDPDYGMFTHYITKLNCGAKLYDFGFDPVDFFTFPMNVGVQQLIDMIDTGYSLINFRGFGAPSYWANSYGYHFLEVGDIPSLSNGFMLPMLTSMTCGGGDFAAPDLDQSFGEVWMKEGSPTNPKGAIGFIGPSEHDTRTQFNNCNDMGIYQGITHEELFRCGEMMLRGKMALYNNYPNNHAWGGSEDSDQFYFYVYNLLGDPGLPVWTDTPKQISMTYPSQINEHQNYIEVEVDVPEDKADFVITITEDDQLIARGITDELGECTLNADLEPGTYHITASKYGYLPKIEGLEVVTDEQLELTNVNFVDQPVSGATIEYEITLYNPSATPINDIDIFLSTEDDEITLLTDSITIPQIQGLSNYVCEDLYLRIDEAWQNGIIPDINAQVQSSAGDQTFIVPVEINSPELVMEDFQVQNADNCLIQDQADDVVIELHNSGSITTDDFTTLLQCTNGKVTILQDQSQYPSVAVNTSGVNTTYFEVQPGEVITGEIAQFELHIVKNDSLVQTLQFSIPIGLIDETSPTFCSYGYYAIESTDAGFFTPPIYDWIELKPELGGQGTLLGADFVSVDGYTKMIDLPFTFTYFGEFFDKISVSSSGWMSMGEELIYHRNRTIPSGAGPSAMIAPFWDYLINGEMYAWFDASEHCFIVEWHAFENYYDPQVKETFEVILYDPEYYPTPTGDGEILFQYQSVGNVDQDENYSTVGIENFDQTEGLLMTFANIYAPTAHELQHETAILFTIKDGPELPILAVSPETITVNVPQDTTITEYLTLENVSDQELTYAVNFSHFSREQQKGDDRNITNDLIISTVGSYVPVIPMDLLCYLYHTSPDNEPVYGISLDFPDGVNVTGAQDIGTLHYNGQTGSGAEITWGFGNGSPIYTSGAHGYEVYVQIDENFTGNLPIEWYIEGDGSGDPPHTKEGTLNLMPSSNTYLYVIYPNGGETLVYGTTDTIRWYSYGDVGNVSLSLSDNSGATWDNIAENIPNSGEYPLLIEFPLSNAYRVRVKEYGSMLNDASDTNFSINVFNIIEPYVGEILQIGTVDTLRWDFAGNYQTVKLEYTRDNGYSWELIDDELPNTGEYVYTVTGPPSDWCAFRITTPDGDMSNRNQGVFSVTESPIDWISTSEPQGTVPAGQNIQIPIEIDTHDLEAGYYEVYVKITSEVGQEIFVPVHLNVSYGVDDEPVQEISITNSPNPFRNQIIFSFSSKEPIQNTEIKIYNIKGQLVRELFHFSSSPLHHFETTWDGKDKHGQKVTPGVYLYQLLINGEQKAERKCLLIE